MLILLSSKIMVRAMLKHKLILSVEERDELHKLIRTGKSAATKLTHARILLAADESIGIKQTDAEIAQQLLVSQKTVQRVRIAAVDQGLEAALLRKPNPNPKPRKMDGEKEAQLIAICCSTPPEGRSTWTMKLLANELIRLEVFETVSPSTVQRSLKKMNLNRG